MATGVWSPSTTTTPPRPALATKVAMPGLPCIISRRTASLTDSPDYVFTSPTGNATTYDGSSFFNAGAIAPGNTFVLTFTTPGTFPYTSPIEMGMRGSVLDQAITPDD